jgi:hypothetical protein
MDMPMKFMTQKLRMNQAPSERNLFQHGSLKAERFLAGRHPDRNTWAAHKCFVGVIDCPLKEYAGSRDDLIEACYSVTDIIRGLFCI